MSTVSISSGYSGDVVFDLKQIVVAQIPPYDAGLDEVSLTLKRGELALVLLEHGLWDHPLSDVISGLLPVASGEVSVFGNSWSDLGPDRQAKSRSRIGRVFERRGWMSNLDVDENITLAQRHHSSRPIEDIVNEAKKLANIIQLPELPAARPAVVGREELRRSEWVRAALGSPWLMLLERPGQDLSNGWRKPCSALVQHLRSTGTAVLWFCEDESEWNDKSLNPSLKLRAEGNTLKAET